MILTYFLCYEESLEFSYYSCWQHTGAMKITKTHSFLFLLDLFLDLVRWDQLVQLLAATGTTSFEISFEMAVGGWAAPVRPDPGSVRPRCCPVTECGRTYDTAPDRPCDHWQHACWRTANAAMISGPGSPGGPRGRPQHFNRHFPRIRLFDLVFHDQLVPPPGTHVPF